jgi:hypothetical protein
MVALLSCLSANALSINSQGPANESGCWECTTFARQLRAVIKKTWILKFRDINTVLTETVAPLALVFLLLWGFSMSGVQTYQATHYTNAPVALTNLGDAIASSVNINTPAGFVNLGNPALSQISPPVTFTDFVTLSQMAPVGDSSNWTAFEEQLYKLVNQTCSEPGIDCSSSNQNGTLNGTNCFGPVCFELNTGSSLAVGDVFSMLSGPLPIPPFDLFIAVSRLAQVLVGDQISEAQLNAAATLTGGTNPLGNLLTLGELQFVAARPSLRGQVDRFITHCNDSTLFFRDVYGRTFNSEALLTPTPTAL